jgi:hypothetical protein
LEKDCRASIVIDLKRSQEESQLGHRNKVTEYKGSSYEKKPVRNLRNEKERS